MTRHLLLLLAVLAATGCDLRDRNAAPEERITAALPPAVEIQATRTALLTQLASAPPQQAALDRAWQARLKSRAATCRRDWEPRWTQSASDIRAHFAGDRCLQDADRELSRWLAMQRVRVALAQPALGKVSAGLPSSIKSRDLIRQVIPARNAPVAILRGMTGFDVVNLATGNSLYWQFGAESTPVGLSPNGRVLSESVQDGVRLRATEGGAILALIEDASQIYWFDDRAVGLRRNGEQQIRLLDLEQGVMSALPGSEAGYVADVVPVIDDPDRFVMLADRRATLVELQRSGTRLGARLVANVTSSTGGFSAASGAATPDAKLWIDGGRGLTILSLDTLEVERVPVGDALVDHVWPTADPDEWLLSTHRLSVPTGTPSAAGFVYERRSGVLQPVQLPAGGARVLQWIPALGRVAVIDGQTLGYLGARTFLSRSPVDGGSRVFSGVSQFETLAKPDDAPAALAELVKDTRIEGIGVYQGVGQRASSDTRATGVVQVRVKPSRKPVTLVLSASMTVTWKITVERGATLAAVLVSAGNPARVDGIGQAPRYDIGRTGTYYRTDPAFQLLARDVAHWTGRSMDTFQGRYDGEQFQVGGE